jgi:predicted phosphodiesterase
MRTISRRKFLGLGALALPAMFGVDACWIEPTSVRVTNLTLNGDGRCRFIHFSDFHYKGNAKFAARVIRTINNLAPDFVCFTGDLVEDRTFVKKALGFVRQIKAPVYGIPGNHDYSSHAPFPEYVDAFATTGGGWLPARSAVVSKHDLEIIGMGITGFDVKSPARAGRRILLMHYPVMALDIPMAGRCACRCLAPSSFRLLSAVMISAITRHRPVQCTLMPGSERISFPCVSTAGPS